MDSNDLDMVAARLRLAGLAALLGLMACRPSRTREAAVDATGVALTTVVSGLAAPLHVTAPPGDSARLFVLEQDGRIRLVVNGRLRERPWLDLTDRVGAGGERGLLSLAFHPRFAETGWIYVNYTGRDGNTRLSRFTVPPGGDTAARDSERLLLRIGQPFANHNGGHLLFGPDGALYAGMGDGGAAGDPANRAQDPADLLGKLLRLDVDALPAEGPAPVTVWARGLRNPWRMNFDPVDRRLWVADVGQNRWEEINSVPDTARGLDYGWRRLEGRQCFLNPVCDKAGTVAPVHVYGHDIGCSVTGGAVYRGRAVPALAGQYVFSDYCGGWIRSLRLAGDSAVLTDWHVQAGQVTSFGTDGRGELYLVNTAGRLLRLDPAPAPAPAGR